MNRVSERLGNYVDWVPGAHRPRPARLGIAALIVLVLLLIVAFAGWRPWAGGGLPVRAQFATAEQLVPSRTPVRVAGVRVGSVDRVERSPDGRGSVVVMKLTDDGVRVSRDASADIGLRTVLAGTRYIDLDPGSPMAPELGDDVIPLSRTSAQVDWDQLNQIFEADVRKGQQQLLGGLHEGLSRPGATGRTLDALGPALSEVGRGLRALRGQNAGDLPRLVSASGRAFAAISRDRSALVRLIASGERALAVTDAHRAALGGALDLTPPALASTEVTMQRLDRTLERLDPLVRELKPGARRLAPATRALKPALGETDNLLRDARPILVDLKPALRNLAAMSREAVPLIDTLDPTVKRLDDELLPWLNDRDPDTEIRNYQSIGPALSVLDSAAGDFDKNGWFFHFPITPTGDSVLLPCGPGLTPGEIRRCEGINDLFAGVSGKKAGGAK